MKILITGASGFLGQAVVGLLVEQGHELFLIGQHEPGLPQATFFKADITKAEQLAKVSQRVGRLDSIIHLAALVPKTADEDLALPMFEVNVKGTINLLSIFNDNKLKNFVYASTAEVYGLPETNKKINEDVLPKPLSNYGASKLAGELFCRVFSQKNNLPITILRFSVMYGPGDAINRAVPNFIKKALKNEPLEIYGGEELRDYLNVDDAAQAIVRAATKQVNGTFNIGTGEGISIKQTAELIIRQINPQLKMTILPRQKKAADIVLDISRARKELGFKPSYKFPDKLEEQIAWHKKR